MAKCKPEPMGRVNCLQLQVAGRDEVSSCRSTRALQGPQLRCQGVLSGKSIRHVSLDTGPSLMLQLHLSANPGLHCHDAALLASAVILVLIHRWGDSDLWGPPALHPDALIRKCASCRLKLIPCQHQCQRCSMTASSRHADLAQHSTASAEEEGWSSLEVCSFSRQLLKCHLLETAS